MTVKEARDIAKKFWSIDIPTQDDIFLFTEAMNYIIEEEHDPDDMMGLGGYYYGQKNFDLALKYYEMAAAYDHDPAYECLGYIWYYGRTGKRDYEKAYEYFHRLMEKGNLTAAYKVADMYRNGYYVEQDQAKYESIIEDLYPKVKDLRRLGDPVPEVYTRLAKIRSEQGREEEAVDLYLYAEDFLAQRLKYDAFFGNLTIMKGLIKDLYELIDFDEDSFDFYDLYYLLENPCKVTFYFEDRALEVEAVREDGECSICFDGQWYRSTDDFFGKAAIGDSMLTSIYDELYGWEVSR